MWARNWAHNFANEGLNYYTHYGKQCHAKVVDILAHPAMDARQWEMSMRKPNIICGVCGKEMIIAPSLSCHF